MDKPKIDLSGQRFGKLTPIEYVGKDKRSNSLWKCKCDCSGEKIVKHAHLTAGHTVSCGCAKADVLYARNTTHGESKTKLYERYCGMIQRCEYEKHISYRHYGAIGISVCEEWRASFLSFKKWAEQNGFKDELILDRINGDGNYSPENCRWVSREVNNQNAKPKKGTKYRGVKKHKDKFRADIQVNGRGVFLGLFTDQESAAVARNIYILNNNLNHRLNIITGER